MAVYHGGGQVGAERATGGVGENRRLKTQNEVDIKKPSPAKQPHPQVKLEEFEAGGCRESGHSNNKSQIQLLTRLTQP